MRARERASGSAFWRNSHSPFAIRLAHRILLSIAVAIEAAIEAAVAMEAMAVVAMAGMAMASWRRNRDRQAN